MPHTLTLDMGNDLEDEFNTYNASYVYHGPEDPGPAQDDQVAYLDEHKPDGATLDDVHRWFDLRYIFGSPQWRDNLDAEPDDTWPYGV